MTMVGKNVKEEARRKLALNMHQAIVIYTVEFTIMITLIALIVLSCVALNSINVVASIVMLCYGIILLFIAIVGCAMLGFAMTDFYLVSYKCKPYNVRRLGETIARSNITKVLLLCLKRTAIAFLLLLCLIVPGVIYLIRTSMAYYLLIANPKMKPKTALTASNKIMSGKTGPYFSLCISLLGWYALGVITLGLGFIFIRPYINLVKAVFYKRNIQGDKAEYSVQQQPVSLAATAVPEQARQGAPVQNAMPDGPAPIDTLAEEDLFDMNAAIQDFGGEVIDDVPEVPLVSPEKKKPDKTKKTKEIKTKAKDEPKHQAVEHRIDGTGLVESERILSTKELDESDLLRQQAIEHMYSNDAQQAPEVNYFDVQSMPDDFNDDFGVEPIADEAGAQPKVEPIENEFEAQPIIEPVSDDIVVQPVVEPVIEEPFIQPVAQAVDSAEPIISDSELDEFLRTFDSEMPVVEEEPAPEPEKPAERHTAPVRPSAREDRRKAAEARIERDRSAAAERLRHRTVEPSERAERLRREREQRLHNNNNPHK